jgi:hypothetical protein
MMTAEKKQILKDFWGAFGSAVLIIILVLIVIGGLVWHFCTRAASVNGASISRLEVIRELESESGEAMLDALVTKKLIAQKATEAGIKINEEDIDAEIKKIDEQIAAQGSTLEVALEQQGITEEKFREQITLQKALEKLLADKISVSDEEVQQYITSTKMSAPEGMSQEDFLAQTKEQLVSQKLGTAAQDWITEQKKNSTIEYFVPYAPEPMMEEMMTPATEEAPASETSENPAPATN